jgi:DNA polymerase III epsilon subunit family exonuclease
MTDWTSLDYAVVDVEGNGRQPPDLVELAVVPIRSGVIGEPSSWLVKPDEPIKHFATQIHGLTGTDVADAPKFADIAEQVRRALDIPALVAHNAHVDVDVLNRKLEDWQPPEVFDTLRLARRLLPGRPSYRLGALANALHLADGLPDGLAPHRATYDALVTARLFILLATRAAMLEDLRGKPPEKADGDAPALF